jgi:hypothetical protein
MMALEKAMIVLLDEEMKSLLLAKCDLLYQSYLYLISNDIIMLYSIIIYFNSLDAMVLLVVSLSYPIDQSISNQKHKRHHRLVIQYNHEDHYPTCE